MTADMRAYLILGAVFLLGTLTGGGVMYAYGRRSEDRFGDGPRGRAHIERRVGALTRQLKLTHDQASRVSAILERQREPRSRLIRETMDRCGEPVRKLRAASDAEIRALLTPEQQRPFDELVLAREKRNAGP